MFPTKQVKEGKDQKRREMPKRCQKPFTYLLTFFRKVTRCVNYGEYKVHEPFLALPRQGKKRAVNGNNNM